MNHQSTRATDLVAERVGQALAVSARRGRGSVTGVRTRDGYVLRMGIGRKQVSAEVRLSGWEGGTQIHVKLPGGVRLSAAEMKKCAALVSSIVGEEAAQES